MKIRARILDMCENKEGYIIFECENCKKRIITKDSNIDTFNCCPFCESKVVDTDNKPFEDFKNEPSDFDFDGGYLRKLDFSLDDIFEFPKEQLLNTQ